MTQQTVTIDNMEHTVELFGSFDSNIDILRKRLNVSIIVRDGQIKISGDTENVRFASQTLERLVELIREGEKITEQDVSYILSLVEADDKQPLDNFGHDVVAITATGKPIKAKSRGQQVYVDAIHSSTITLGIGPAGTGKTYLAVALAVRAFKAGEISRIILTRPAVEAGEKLGFLPGDLQTKVDPYLRPLHDALYEMFGSESYEKHLERGTIEIAPLAYMRGRTLEDSFIILDEAQNTTQEQMKMFLTRLGFGSKVVITGDITQIDLPIAKSSGLVQASDVLKDIDDISIIYLSNSDVVRHRLVQKIVIAYEEYNKTKRSEGKNE